VHGMSKLAQAGSVLAQHGRAVPFWETHLLL
jgi:hypothetical protein